MGRASLLFAIWAAASVAEAKPAGKVLTFLRQISGHQTVGGVHNDQKTGGVAYYTDRLATVTGRVPGLWSGDFSYDGRIQNRWALVYEAEKQWKAGALVNLMWHACPPTVPEPCSWDGDIHSRLSAAEWTDLVTEGGTLNREWKKRMDRIAPYLGYLQEKGVEVLWRPHHEMNQGNFWWGGRPGPDGTARLYRLTHDYLTLIKGLDNLVWTWDIQDLRFDWAAYHPGDAWFDVLALDMYSMGYTDSLYNSLLRLAGNKVIALGEVQKVPSPAVLAKYPRYAFVMAWAYMTFDSNSEAALRETYTATSVLTRDELPGWDKVAVSARSAAPGTGSGLRVRLDQGILEVITPAAGGSRVRVIDASGRTRTP